MPGFWPILPIAAFKDAISWGDADHGWWDHCIASTYCGFWFLVDLTGRENGWVEGGPPPAAAELRCRSSWIEVAWLVGWKFPPTGLVCLLTGNISTGSATAVGFGKWFDGFEGFETAWASVSDGPLDWADVPAGLPNFGLWCGATKDFGWANLISLRCLYSNLFWPSKLTHF